MLFCPKCGVAISKESEFCHRCGHELVMPEKEEALDLESHSSSVTAISTEEETPPEIYAKSKLVVSLCAIGMFPFLMNINLVTAICFLVGGIFGLLTHRVKDLGGRKGFAAIAGLPVFAGAFIGIWSINSLPEIIIIGLASLIFALPFRLGSKY